MSASYAADLDMFLSLLRPREAWQSQRTQAATVKQRRHEAEARWAKLRPELDDGRYYESG